MSDEKDIVDLDDEENIVELETEDGEKVSFEFLDYITYKKEEYVVLLPVEDSDGSVVILKVEPQDGDLENYVPVDSSEDLNAVYELFKERNAELFNFED